MIETKIYYNQDQKSLVIEYKNNLLTDYSDILAKLLVEEQSKGHLAGARIERLYPNRINLVVRAEEGVKQGNYLNIPTDMADSINRLFNNFAVNAFKARCSRYEIIPLKNYDISRIKTDIRAMVKNGRDLCVISDYNDYLKANKEQADKVSLVQATYKYLSDDYCNIVIAADAGDMTEIADIVKDKLKMTDWM